MSSCIAGPRHEAHQFLRHRRPPTAKAADKKQEYADRAIELLHKAIKPGYHDAAHMAKDKDLDGLRERDDFKKLLAELEAAAQSKTKEPRHG